MIKHIINPDIQLTRAGNSSYHPCLKAVRYTKPSNCMHNHCFVVTKLTNHTTNTHSDEPGETAIR